VLNIGELADDTKINLGTKGLGEGVDFGRYYGY
jgi:hypothetical protein